MFKTTVSRSLLRGRTSIFPRPPLAVEALHTSPCMHLAAATAPLENRAAFPKVTRTPHPDPRAGPLDITDNSPGLRPTILGGPDLSVPYDPLEIQHHDIYLTSTVDRHSLKEHISPLLGIEYLQKVPHVPELESHRPIRGKMTSFLRPWVPITLAPVDGSQAAVSVPFMLDTGSTRTFISEHVCSHFGIDMDSQDAIYILLNGNRFAVQTPTPLSHFREACLLGLDFLNYFHTFVQLDFKARELTVGFSEIDRN